MDKKENRLMTVHDSEELKQIIRELPEGVILEIAYEEGEKQDEI